MTANHGEKIRRIDWDEYSRLCRLIAKQIQERHQPETVVGIAHGGVIVGATVATILGRDFFPIKFSRRVNASVVRKHAKLLVPPTAHLENKRVLVVDDASFSGETMRAAVRAIKKLQPHKVITAVLVRRGAYEPDYAATYFAGEVRFPWQGEGNQDKPGSGLPSALSRKDRLEKREGNRE